ncbi:MAG: hypothetical protein AXA67_01830 [Methylothermaceae bacteria B42]|nr:MAG: hypothetical protein AXA67_01830 [Methylothermaceae bacteria B42]HHJ37843.1 hypothetical protein [Methylothermaceae bacterium]
MTNLSKFDCWFLLLIFTISLILAVVWGFPEKSLGYGFDLRAGGIRSIVGFIVYFIILSSFTSIIFVLEKRFVDRVFFRKYLIYWLIATPMALLLGRWLISGGPVFPFKNIYFVILIVVLSVFFISIIMLLPLIQRYNILGRIGKWMKH